MNLSEKLTGVIRTVPTKVRADEDTPKSESIQVFLDIDYSDCSIEDVLTFAGSNRAIGWASGSGGRKVVGSLKPGQHIKVRASSPGRAPAVDGKAQIAAEIAGMSDEEALTHLRDEIAKMRALKG